VNERETVARVGAEKWNEGNCTSAVLAVAEEVPVALEYNGISHAVMLATPADLEDFALGFSITEGILSSPADLFSSEIDSDESGIRIAMEIAGDRFYCLKEKRRNLTGRTGCGLCGAESLTHAVHTPLPVESSAVFSAAALHAGFLQMEDMQQLRNETGATHAAAWLTKDGTVTLVREDVGRHNALDKLIGALLSAKIDVSSGAALVTSRASYEMVQKTAAAGIGILAAVSAPTALAVRMAHQANLTLAGFVRPGRHVVYACADRIK